MKEDEISTADVFDAIVFRQPGPLDIPLMDHISRPFGEDWAEVSQGQNTSQFELPANVSTSTRPSTLPQCKLSPISQWKGCVFKKCGL